MIRETRLGEVLSFEVARAARPWLALWTVRVYILDRVMIDTGPPNMRGPILDLARRLDIEAVILTHHHEDHAGNAHALATEIGLPVFAAPRAIPLLAEGGGEALFQLLTWGRRKPVTAVPVDRGLKLSSTVFEPLEAPGHSADMTCWLVKDKGILFSGDLYIADRVRLFRFDESLSETIRSLERIAAIDFDSLMCGHNPKPTHGSDRLKAKRDYLLELRDRVRAMAARGAPPDRIAGRLLGSDKLIRFVTGGRVSTLNLVRSALESE